MKKIILIVAIVVVAVGLGIWWLIGSEIKENNLPSSEEAQVTGYGFMVDFLAIAPPISDEEATDRAYEALSSSAKEQISRENIAAEMASFVGVQDIPDRGIDIEDFQVVEEDRAVLTLKLNYSGGWTTREISLVVEEGEWKVDNVVVGPFESTELDPRDIPVVNEVVSLAAEQSGLDESEIRVILAEEIQWPDSCLGLAETGELCSQVMVPGYEILLEVGEEAWIFRTDEDGSIIRRDERNL